MNPDFLHLSLILLEQNHIKYALETLAAVKWGQNLPSVSRKLK